MMLSPVIRMYPLGTLNICIKSHDNPSNNLPKFKSKPQMGTSWQHKKKSQGMPTLSGIHTLGIMNIYRYKISWQSIQLDF